MTLIIIIIPTDLFVVWVADDQKSVIRPREDVLPRVIPGYGVDLQTVRKTVNVTPWLFVSALPLVISALTFASCHLCVSHL